MSAKADVCIVLLTYNRLDYAEATLRSVLENITCSQAVVHLHIADDGSGDEYVSHLQVIAGHYLTEDRITTTDAKRGGYGRNYNLAMQVAHSQSDIILPLEDDWILSRPLDVRGMIDDMRELDIGCLRLGYIGYTQPLNGTFSFAKVHQRHYLELAYDSPEPHVFAGHPRLETVEWARSVGPWPEELDPGTTEFVVAHNWRARQGVYWPIDEIPPSGGLFQHIGTIRSY